MERTKPKKGSTRWKIEGTLTKEKFRSIRIDEGKQKNQLSEIVRESVEDALNCLIEAEADNFYHA